MAESRWKIPAHISAHDTGEGLFIYHQQLGTCFGLDGIGMEIWKMIELEMTHSEMVIALQQTYVVDEVEAFQDVQRFIDQLHQRQLLDAIERG